MPSPRFPRNLNQRTGLLVTADMALPRAPEFDSTRAFFREGYNFVGDRCRQLDTDIFATRIMLYPVVCIMGDDAARQFYGGRHFTRQGAMPQTTLRLLQDKNSVQSLDGAAHSRRKALFLDMLTGEAVEQVGRLFDARWRAALPSWRRRSSIILHDEMVTLLCEVACAWTGVPVAGDTLRRRAHETGAMVAAAGTAGPRAWGALLLRQRAERWARAAVVAIRKTRPHGYAAAPVERIARYQDEDGRLLDPVTAGVELINLIRPMVAVARFITFAALALAEHSEAAAWLLEDPDARSAAFADEVRRFYPFFPVIGGRVRQGFIWRDHPFGSGDWVLLGLHATNHDPRLWGDPHFFRPQRFLDRGSDGYDLVAQGAGRHAADHRCPGEEITVELIRRALAQLLALDYRLPEQRRDVPLNRFPTLPRSGLVMALG